jgi:hypothetical protein
MSQRGNLAAKNWKRTNWSVRARWESLPPLRSKLAQRKLVYPPIINTKGSHGKKTPRSLDHLPLHPLTIFPSALPIPYCPTPCCSQSRPPIILLSTHTPTPRHSVLRFPNSVLSLLSFSCVTGGSTLAGTICKSLLQEIREGENLRQWFSFLKAAHRSFLPFYMSYASWFGPVDGCKSGYETFISSHHLVLGY